MKITASKRLQGLPPYAFKEITDKVEELRVLAKNGQAKTPIDFGVGDPSEPTPDFVIEGLTGAGRKHARGGYPLYIGSGEFRAECADYMKRRFGISLNPETEISSNIGAKEAVFNFPEAFLNPGDVAICPSPGYPPYKTGTIFAEGEPYYVPLLAENGFLIDYDSIPADVCERAKIIWINYPNSPTGAVATREYYEGLLAWAKRHDIVVAADEGCYIDIYFDEKPISILEVGREGVAAFYSLSKRNNMTGYRVGFVCGDKAVIDIFKRLKTNIDSGTPNIIQEAAILALRDDEHVAKMRALYREKKDILLSALRGIELSLHDAPATFYVWQKVPGSDVEFAKKLLDPSIGIVVTPGSLISDECLYGRRDVASDSMKINPGFGYVRFALMPTLEEMHEVAIRLGKLKF